MKQYLTAWSDEVNSCKDSNILLRMKLGRKLRQPAVIAWTGKSISLSALLWGILDEAACFQLPAGVVIELHCIVLLGVASVCVWWRETRNVCPNTWDCKRTLESVVPLSICQNAFLIKSLNSEYFIMPQLMSQFSFGWKWKCPGIALTLHLLLWMDDGLKGSKLSPIQQIWFTQVALISVSILFRKQSSLLNACVQTWCWCGHCCCSL